MNLREAAEAALKAMSSFESGTNGLYEGEFTEEIAVLRAALAEPERKPLTEEQVDRAYQEIWRDSPDDFGPTAGDWIEAGIRYAERLHGITGDKDGSQG